jgi:hypothetical protein
MMRDPVRTVVSGGSPESADRERAGAAMATQAPGPAGR